MLHRKRLRAASEHSWNTNSRPVAVVAVFVTATGWTTTDHVDAAHTNDTERSTPVPEGRMHAACWSLGRQLDNKMKRRAPAVVTSYVMSCVTQLLSLMTSCVSVCRTH